MTAHVITATGQFPLLTLAAGDTITTNDVQLAEFWDVNQSGANGNPIIFNDISLTGSSARAYCIDVTDSSYININGSTFSDATTRNIFGNAGSPGISLNNIESIGGVLGLWIIGRSASSYRNLSFSGQSGGGFWLSAAATGVTIENVSVTGGGDANGSFRLHHLTDLTATGLELNDSTNTGIYFRYCAGLFRVDGITVDNSGDTNLGSIFFKDNTGITAGSYLKNVTVTNSNKTGLLFYDGDSSHLTGENWTITGSDGSGIEIKAATVGKVTGLAIANSGVSGITAQTSGGGTFADGVISSSAWDGLSSAGAATLNCTRMAVSLSGTNGNANTGDGFTAHDTSVNNICSFSLFKNNKNTALAVIGATGGTFYRNTCVDNHAAGFVRGQWWFADATGPGWVCRGNINVNLTTGDDYAGILVMIAAGGDIPTLDYNCYWSTNPTPFWVHNGGATGTAADYDKYDFAGWKTLSGQDAHSIFADPLFVDYAGGDFRLQATSPCKNAGIVL